MSGPIRVMLVDDHVFFRRGVQQIVDAESDMKVVAEAGDGVEAVRKAVSQKPDVILMDISMPRMNGTEAVKRILEEHPSGSIIMLSISDTDEDLFGSIRAGAIGFLTKDVSPERVTEAIRGAVRGEASVSPHLAARMVEYIRYGDPQQPSEATGSLTARETEILHLIARGARDREIGAQLFISESTVKKHVQNVLRKLHARNRAEAVSRLDQIDRHPRT